MKKARIDEVDTPAYKCLADLQNTDLGPEPAESAYRRGYRDGMLVEYNYIQDMVKTSAQEDRKLRAFWDWMIYGDLWKWVSSASDDNAERVLPPEYKKPGEIESNIGTGKTFNYQKY